MKYSKYKERCERRNKWVNYYDTSSGMIVCHDCKAKADGKVLLDEPKQLSIYDVLYGESR